MANCSLQGYASVLASRDPDIWRNPEKFDAGRFLSESRGTKVTLFLQDNPTGKELNTDRFRNSVSVARNSQIGQNGFCPFGFGRNQCPSQNLSLAITKVFASRLLGKYNVHVSDVRQFSHGGLMDWEMKVKLNPLVRSSGHTEGRTNIELDHFPVGSPASKVKTRAAPLEVIDEDEMDD